MALQDKLDDYNAIHRFQENPDHFSFSFNPERIIIRNEALRTGNKDLYETFLRNRYPDHADTELEMFDKTKANTHHVTVEEAKAFFDRNAVSILLADLVYSDPDSIFTAKIRNNQDAGTDINEMKEPMMAYLPISIINGKRLVWIDASEVQQAFNP